MTAPSDSGPLRTLLVEDQGIIRMLFKLWIETIPGCTLAGSARSGEEALELLESTQPDVALVDLHLPGMDGLEFIRAARQIRPQMRSIMVTSQLDALSLMRVRESGAEGFVEKDSTPEVLAQALKAVAEGGTYYSARFQQIIAREAAKSQGVGKILSKREQQVLAHVLNKKANREIGELMGLSTRTVEFHRANLMAKLEASNFDELVVAAKLRGWTK